MCHRVPGRQRQHERYRPKLYQRIYGSQPVFCTSHQSVFPQCVTTEFLWISTVWNYQHGKYRHDSTGGIDIGSSVGNGRSDCTDILCDHDGICSDKSIFRKSEKRRNPCNSDCSPGASICFLFPEDTLMVLPSGANRS